MFDVGRLKLKLLFGEKAPSLSPLEKGPLLAKEKGGARKSFFMAGLGALYALTPLREEH